MKTSIAILFVTASLCVAATVDSDGDGMPDVWEEIHGFNATNATDAVADADRDGFTNLEEFRAGSDPVGPSGPCIDYALYVHKVVMKGTNRWIRFLQFAGKPVWVREGKPDGPIGGVPDWSNRKLWNQISRVTVDDSVHTNIQVLVTFVRKDETNTWSAPFVGDSPRMILKEEDKKQANKPNGE